MKSNSVLTVVATVVFFLGDSALAEENPMFKSWAKHGVGTSVTTTVKTKAAGQETAMEVTTSLEAKSADKVSLKIVTKMTVAGTTMELPGQTIDIPAVTPPVEKSAADAPKPETKENTAKIKITDKEFNTKVIESTTTIGKITTTSKSWTSEEIPGMMLKMETKTTGEFPSESTMVVTKVTIKK